MYHYQTVQQSMSSNLTIYLVSNRVFDDGYGKQVPPSTKGVRGISSYRNGSVVMKSPRPPFSKGEVSTRHSMLQAVLDRTLAKRFVGICQNFDTDRKIDGSSRASLEE
jgi:hypothetical protein